METIVNGIEYMNNLDERERLVLNLRFGLNGRLKYSLNEIAKMIPNRTTKAEGVTRERVRQIEAKALQKLKHYKKRGE